MMSLAASESFCRRMAIALRAGVDILKVLESETKVGSPQHREIMEKLTEKIRDGFTLADAMKEHGRYFPRMLVMMVGASELAGQMDQMFYFMADYYKQLKSTRWDFLKQITWPCIQLGLAILIIGLVILLQAVLTPNAPYDATALGLRGLGGFYLYCLIVTGSLTFIVIVGFALWKNWFNSHRITVPLVQHIPVLGSAFVTLALSRMSTTLSMLLNAGVEAQRATRQSFLATGNHYYISAMDRSLEEIEKGSSFGDAFAEAQVFPDEFIENMRLGELSGTETESLDRLAVQYQERAQAALSTIATIASFTIWIGVMILLAFMVIRMALQYINMLNSFLP